MQELISTIIPTYNRAHLITETLNSVLAQSYTNWECIIVDDGSTDRTLAIIKTFTKKDARFKIFERPENFRKGAAVCRNIGLRNAKGSYIQFLDSDDLLESNKFESQLDVLTGKDKLSMATCKWGRLDKENSNPKKYSSLPIYRNYSNPSKLLKAFGNRYTFFPVHCYLTSVSLIKLAGNWNEDLTVNDDGEFFSRVILNSNSIFFTGKTYAIYRSGSGNRLSQLETEEQIEQYIKSWKLIDETVINLINEKDHPYTKHAKTMLYHKVKLKFPNLIERNKEFFKNRRSNAATFYYKVINRIQQ